MSDDKGLFDKYRITRVDLQDFHYTDKHFGCKLFVLDLTHDYHARQVMYGYAARILKKQPKLGQDLFDLLEELDHVESQERPGRDETEIEISIPDPKGVDRVAALSILTQAMTDMFSSGEIAIKREIEEGFRCAVCREGAARPIGLVGGYDTVLCTDHTNAWHSYIIEHPEFLNLDVINIDYTIALFLEERTSALKFKKQEREVKKQLFAIGEEWVKTNYEEYQMKLASLRLRAMRDDMHLDDTE